MQILKILFAKVNSKMSIANDYKVVAGAGYLGTSGSNGFIFGIELANKRVVLYDKSWAVIGNIPYTS